MFYTESIMIKTESISIWSRIVKYFEKIGTARAQREMDRLGYTKEYLESLGRKNLID
jgi:hypothetical protein